MKQWLYLNLMHGWAWLIIHEYYTSTGSNIYSLQIIRYIKQYFGKTKWNTKP